MEWQMMLAKGHKNYVSLIALPINYSNEKSHIAFQSKES